MAMPTDKFLNRPLESQVTLSLAALSKDIVCICSPRSLCRQCNTPPPPPASFLPCTWGELEQRLCDKPKKHFFHVIGDGPFYF